MGVHVHEKRMPKAVTVLKNSSSLLFSVLHGKICNQELRNYKVIETQKLTLYIRVSLVYYIGYMN